jgi:anhydro-N-acetylmuramic acid kinase
MKIIGLMSGTSADGIDAAVVDVTGSTTETLGVELISFTFVPYEPEQRASIFPLFDPATGTVDRICQMNFAIGDWFAGAALLAMREAGLQPSDIDLIASHGQTIYHSVEAESPVKSTLQIGEAAVIAQRTGVTTIADFRVADVAADGQGAPLVSHLDWLLLRDAVKTRAVQNIGGIGNVTYLPPGENPDTVLAFDTGPGNMLIDYATSQATGGAQRYDRDGQIASSGQVDHALVAEWMAHPYFALPIPKTTGREQFGVQLGEELWAKAMARGMSGDDIVATLTAFTAESIADAYARFLPTIPDEVFIGGGGANNPTLMVMLAKRLPSAQVKTLDEFDRTQGAALNISSDSREAVSFAIMGYETIHGRPSNLPSCTGATESAVLGKVTPGTNYRRLMREVMCG